MIILMVVMIIMIVMIAILKIMMKIERKKKTINYYDF